MGPDETESPKPQRPKTGHAQPPAIPAEELELSASGFVGMLSRRRVKEPDPLGAPPATPRERPTSMPSPKPVAKAASESKQTASSSPGMPWRATFRPELYLFGLFLVVVGLWSAAGLLWPGAVPLGLGDPVRHKVALALLACVPVGLAVLMGTWIRSKHANS